MFYSIDQPVNARFVPCGEMRFPYRITVHQFLTEHSRPLFIYFTNQNIVHHLFAYPYVGNLLKRPEKEC